MLKFELWFAHYNNEYKQRLPTTKTNLNNHEYAFKVHEFCGNVRKLR